MFTKNIEIYLQHFFIWLILKSFLIFIFVDVLCRLFFACNGTIFWRAWKCLALKLVVSLHLVLISYGMEILFKKRFCQKNCRIADVDKCGIIECVVIILIHFFATWNFSSLSNQCPQIFFASFPQSPDVSNCSMVWMLFSTSFLLIFYFWKYTYIYLARMVIFNNFLYFFASSTCAIMSSMSCVINGRKWVHYDLWL